jgi:hypothetical protein
VLGTIIGERLALALLRHGGIDTVAEHAPGDDGDHEECEDGERDDPQKGLLPWEPGQGADSARCSGNSRALASVRGIFHLGERNLANGAAIGRELRLDGRRGTSGLGLHLLV